MFKEMRRKDRELETGLAIKLLEKGQYGILSTVGENGYAYGVPINYVYHNGSIYFHCAREGSKLDNIAYNNRVSFCVVGYTEPVSDEFSYRYESTIVFGKASEVYDDEKKEVLTQFIKKYSGTYMDSGMDYIRNSIGSVSVIRIDIEHITGKARR